MDNVIDFTDAEPGYRDYGGSDSKLSLQKNGVHYMVKFAEQKIKTSEIATSESNSIFSEYVGLHIAKTMGLEVHNTKLGLYKGEPVVACEDFVQDGWKLQEFEWFMRTVFRKGQIGRIPTYEQIYMTINESMLSVIKEEAVSRYWDTFILDAFIGNFDRHKGNWGYLVNEKEKIIRLAPIYDCGSSIYPALSERGFDQILTSDTEIDLRIFEFPKPAINRNSDPFKIDKFSYQELLFENRDVNCSRALMRVYPHIDMEKVYRVIDETPIISVRRKNFYKEMLTHRKERLLDKAYEIVQQMDLSEKKIVHEDVKRKVTVKSPKL